MSSSANKKSLIDITGNILYDGPDGFYNDIKFKSKAKDNVFIGIRINDDITLQFEIFSIYGKKHLIFINPKSKGIDVSIIFEKLIPSKNSNNQIYVGHYHISNTKSLFEDLKEQFFFSSCQEHKEFSDSNDFIDFDDFNDFGELDTIE